MACSWLIDGGDPNYFQVSIQVSYKVGPYLVISGVISQFIGVITQVTQLQVHL